MKRKKSEKAPVIDIGYDSIRVHVDGACNRVPVTRDANHRIDADSRDAAVARIRELLGVNGRGSKRAVCALPARGVSLRHLDLPPLGKAAPEQILSLQVEKEFPLPPDQIAWGYRLHKSASGNGAGPRAADVVALRQDVIDDYTQLMSDCGVQPTFGVGLLAAGQLVESTESYCVLDVGGRYSELAHFDDGRPRVVRTLSWGGEAITDQIAKKLAVDAETARKLKHEWTGSLADPRPSENPAIYDAMQSAVHELVEMLADAWPRGSENGGRAPSSLYLTGNGARVEGFAEALGRVSDGRVRCERLALPSADDSGVTVGLRHAIEPLHFRSTAAPRAATATPQGAAQPWIPWVALAVLLGLTSLALRSVPALLQLPDLEERIENAKRELETQPSVDRELGFLEHLKEQQLPTLDLLAVVAEKAPKGMLIDEIELDQGNRVIVVGSGADEKKADALRKFLVDEGWIERAVVEVFSGKGGSGFRIEGRLARRTPIDRETQVVPVPGGAKGNAATTNVVAAPVTTEKKPAESTETTAEPTAAPANAEAPTPGTSEVAPEEAPEEVAPPEVEFIVPEGGRVINLDLNGIDPAVLEELQNTIEIGPDGTIIINKDGD